MREGIGTLLPLYLITAHASHTDLTIGYSCQVMPDDFLLRPLSAGLLLTLPSGTPQVLCTGVGFGTEKAHIRTEEPLRGEGLTNAIREALAECGCEIDEMNFRITDLSGEQYYFKEASLAVGRTLRKLKEEFDIWHPAECIGEAGALAGVAIVAVAYAACHKKYALGPNILLHMANDDGQRAAAIIQFTR